MGLGYSMWAAYYVVSVVEGGGLTASCDFTLSSPSRGSMLLKKYP